MKHFYSTHSTLPMRTAKIGYIVLSVLLCVLGVVLMVFPTFSASVLEMICGAVFIAFGIIKLIGFFSKDLYRLAFQFDLEFGILMIILGVFILVHTGSILHFICILLGILVLADALFRMRAALDARKFGITQWWMILAIAVVAAVFGVILIFHPEDGTKLIMIYLGMTLLFEGILSLTTALTMVKIIKLEDDDDLFL